MAGAPKTREVDAALLQRHTEQEAQRALGLGSLVMLAFAGVGLVVTLVMGAFDTMRDLRVPQLSAALGVLAALWIRSLAVRGRLTRTAAYPVFFSLSVIPTAVLALAEWGTTGSAGTYLNGPMVGIYPLVIVLSGFMFDLRLSLFSGIIAAAGFLTMYFLSADHVALVTTPDPLMYDEIATLPPYIVRAGELVFTGLIVGTLATSARRLVLRAVREEREKAGISRLFGQYVSEDIKDRILRDDAELGSERKHVVVLFSDLRGFSSYAESADPLELVAHLNEYFDRMVDCVSRNGGTIDKFIGDAIMAVFGGLTDLDNPAAAALRAALEMRSELDALNARWRQQGRAELANGVGIHAGDVVMGSIGSAARKEFTVIGDAVNTAARLESASKELAYPVIVSRAVYDSLPDELRAVCTDLGSIHVKGKVSAVEVYGCGG